MKLDTFCEAFARKDAETVESQLNAYLKKTISIRDTAVRKEKKENFYHGILLGLLSHCEDWIISSNAESGNGYSDILVETGDGLGIVIEIKYADNRLETVLQYGIACWKKKCKVKLAE